MMTIRERVEALANDEGMLTSDQAYLLIDAHFLAFSAYCKEKGCDFRAEDVLQWLGY